MTTHNETCACGATLSYIGNDPSAAARRFREGHRCSQPAPPGPCWHDSGVTWLSGERPRCDQLAGHAGAHTWKRPNGGEAVWTETASDQHRPNRCCDHHRYVEDGCCHCEVKERADG